MSFKSLNHILVALENQALLDGLQMFRHLLACWSEVVGVQAASHTRPVSISRGVLWVATSSSSWASNLSFQRHRLLKKLNAQLPSPLVDIRFSTAQWQNNFCHNSVDAEVWEAHPSRIDAESLPSFSQTPELKDPQAAFQHWADLVQERSQQLPLCPHCQCPTPIGELQRWGVCALCSHNFNP